MLGDGKEEDYPEYGEMWNMSIARVLGILVAAHVSAKKQGALRCICAIWARGFHDVLQLTRLPLPFSASTIPKQTRSASFGTGSMAAAV